MTTRVQIKHSETPHTEEVAHEHVNVGLLALEDNDSPARRGSKVPGDPCSDWRTFRKSDPEGCGKEGHGYPCGRHSRRRVSRLALGISQVGSKGGRLGSVSHCITSPARPFNIPWRLLGRVRCGRGYSSGVEYVHAGGSGLDPQHTPHTHKAGRGCVSTNFNLTKWVRKPNLML